MASGLDKSKLTDRVYDKIKLCPICHNHMNYIYGEMFQCPSCGRKERTDFGKVREFLEIAGPQPAVIIAEETGVELKVIEKFLREGRVEIPDGSPVYIKCQSCGTDIRYGRYCPDCMLRLSKSLSVAILAPEVGEKPRTKSGKMHTLEPSEGFGRRSRNKDKMSGDKR